MGRCIPDRLLWLRDTVVKRSLFRVFFFFYFYVFTAEFDLLGLRDTLDPELIDSGDSYFCIHAHRLHESSLFTPG